jgi:tetratricopeptide (TPR) repeat protein
MSRVTVDQAIALAMQHHQAGLLPQAEQLCRLVLSAEPDHAIALNLMGILAYRAGRLDVALDLFRRAVAIDPASVEFQTNLGNILSQTEPRAAVEIFQKAIALQPDRAEIHNNLGAALAKLDLTEQAMAAHRKATLLDPDLAPAHSNLGNQLLEMGRAEEAIASHRRAVALQPGNADAHWNLAIALLAHGQWAEGWREFEWRLKVFHSTLGMDSNAEGSSKGGLLEGRLWNGSDLAGRKLLLVGEQGFGDTLQLVRYAQILKDRGGRLGLQCHQELVPLLRQLDSLDELFCFTEPAVGYDLWCPLMSVPNRLGTTLDKLPPPTLLRASAKKSAYFANRIRQLTAGRNDTRRSIGMVWAGQAEHKNDRNRSMSLQALLPLMQSSPARFVSLQKGPAGAHAADLPLNPINWLDLTGELFDFADTAALIANLDLVISVDTAVAHLAGSMGKPVWLLLPFAPDWRWMLNRVDSPWYPTMRIFRQTRPGDWAGVVEAVIAAMGPSGF